MNMVSYIEHLQTQGEYQKLLKLKTKWDSRIQHRTKLRIGRTRELESPATTTMGETLDNENETQLTLSLEPEQEYHKYTPDLRYLSPKRIAQKHTNKNRSNHQITLTANQNKGRERTYLEKPYKSPVHKKKRSYESTPWGSDQSMRRGSGQ